MSRPINVNKTINLYPTGINVSQSSYATASNNANAETDTDSTTYSTISLNTGANVSSYVTYTFDIDENIIPDGATITAITCQIKARISSTSYITTAVAQLYADTVAKGGTVSFRSTTTSPTPTAITNVGSWTLNELRTARIRFTATRGTSSTTRSASMNIYGTDLNITYTFNGMGYEVTASSRINGYSISPTSEEIYGRESIAFTIGGESDETLIVIDNGIDVTNQLVQIAASHSENLHATGYTNLSSGITINSSYPITRAYREANTTTYARLDFNTSTTGYIELSFDIPDIPSSATITNLTAKAGLRVSSTTRMTSTVCQLYSGSTAKGSNTTFGSTIATIYNLRTGSWTASEVADLRMRIGATSSESTSSKYIYLYGADITIDYELEGNFYTYTISNISADHVVTVGLPFEEKFFIKQANSWNRVIKIYKKENGSWVEKTLSYLSDNNINYLKYIE